MEEEEEDYDRMERLMDVMFCTMAKMTFLPRNGFYFTPINYGPRFFLLFLTHSNFFSCDTDYEFLLQTSTSCHETLFVLL